MKVLCIFIARYGIKLVIQWAPSALLDVQHFYRFLAPKNNAMAQPLLE
ncbi:hypothetical protein Cenrod_0531 [Candidatus Symbiobacter mobilis CR]|uniref:Uncharacterized protein n=1 Tax=Candidatus Symbiobacter mobilis CR TaxID=946483 RepID=U5N5T8_9BURK|nr:hypothetical protein Cenrod_0531 [Candidatus Symbiobacter mobilis CR]